MVTPPRPRRHTHHTPPPPKTLSITDLYIYNKPSTHMVRKRRIRMGPLSVELMPDFDTISRIVAFKFPEVLHKTQ